MFGSNSISTRLTGSAISATKSITVDSDERLKESVEQADRFVVQDENGYYSVKAADLVFHLIATMQKLTKEVEMLKNN